MMSFSSMARPRSSRSMGTPGAMRSTFQFTSLDFIDTLLAPRIGCGHLAVRQGVSRVGLRGGQFFWLRQRVREMPHAVTLLDFYCGIMAAKLYSACHKVFTINKEARWGIWRVCLDTKLSLCQYMWFDSTPYLCNSGGLFIHRFQMNLQAETPAGRSRESF